MKTAVRFFYYLFALIFSKIVILIPYRWAVALGGYLGAAAYHCVGRSREITERNLRRAFPGKSDDEIRGIAREVFVNQGKNLFELFSFPKLSRNAIECLVNIENRGGMEKAFAGGKGVLIASAHCGNWEMMGAALSSAGFPINVIARRIYIEGLNRMLVDLRTSKGMRVILRSGQESARQMLRSLRQNEALAMLIDQDTAVPGVFVEFFSRPAWTPSGLASLALRTGCAVVLALDLRLSGERHRVILSDPIDLVRTGDSEKDIRENTRLITSMIEGHVRRYPAQWVWMHERWKTQAAPAA